jgi:hypothetical protein
LIIGQKETSAKRRRSPLDVDAVDENGFLADIDVTPLTASAPSKSAESATRDVDHFFGPVYEKIGSNGQAKKHRDCKKCP